MQDYARRLGSDCAFFIENTPVYCYGKGDQFSNISLDLSNYYIVLVNPQIHVGTAEAYAGIIPTVPGKNVQEILQLPIEQWKGYLANDFEKSIFAKYPEVKALKETLYTQGALYASMSGSGSTVYGIFNKEIQVKPLFPEHYQLWQGKL
jgi:4-diphosphocytidyl-2-C-methyl-D-erythritol kinase